MRRTQGSDPKSYAGRPTETSELLGQVFTPPEIADRMARLLLQGRQPAGALMLDPAVGPGTFPEAMLRTGCLQQTDTLHLFDVDPEMIRLAKSNTSGLNCHKDFRCCDYITSPSLLRYDYAILNPPYVRQEWLDAKYDYQCRFLNGPGLKIPGTSNLYVYFLAKVVGELWPGGRLVCIVYDSWQSTKYGRWLSRFLELNCSDIMTHAVKSQPFKGALIDATIITATRSSAPLTSPDHVVQGHGTRAASGPFADAAGFTMLETRFKTLRGLRLKQAAFFLCDANDAGRLGATPFVKKPASIADFAVAAEHPEAALLLSASHHDARTYGELSRRLDVARSDPDTNRSILTWYGERPDTWYLHRTPPFAPLLFNYYIRNRPKHIRNSCHPYSDNFYGLTPEDDCPLESLLALLNSTCVAVSILANCRNQGHGLAKIQLYEYRRVPIPDHTLLGKQTLRRMADYGVQLIEAPRDAATIVDSIDALLYAELADEQLRPATLQRLYAEFNRSAKRPRQHAPSCTEAPA